MKSVFLNRRIHVGSRPARKDRFIQFSRTVSEENQKIYWEYVSRDGYVLRSAVTFRYWGAENQSARNQVAQDIRRQRGRLSLERARGS